ncbi:MAG: hypothetical protein KTR16_13450, partial [Acidiferrobacterales bacterium]|nr:hypothetical protein [Acidiferrobacterales bacterium]
VRKDLASVTMQLESLKNDGNAYATEIKLRDTGLYSLKLWKPVFSVEGLKGKITRFRMSCDAGIKGIEFIENVEYQIPKSYGDCTLRIKGEPGSTFSLVQLPVAEPQA